MARPLAPDAPELPDPPRPGRRRRRRRCRGYVRLRRRGEHRVVSPRGGAYLDRHGIALRLGNGFRTGLERLAVIEQPREGAADIGQPLPGGLLRDVWCAPVTARPAAGRAWPWRCRVRWETAAGAPRSLRYAVRLLPGGCFAAGARPALPARLDPTIKTYAEDPLNTIVSVRRGC